MLDNRRRTQGRLQSTRFAGEGSCRSPGKEPRTSVSVRGDHGAFSPHPKPAARPFDLVLWVSPSVTQAQSAPTSLEAAIESITDQTILSHLSVLASDQLRGRDTPSAGLETAAAYLADRIGAYGLDPAGTSGTFFQRYPFGLMGPDPDNAQVTFVGPRGSVEVRMGRDAFLEGGSDAVLDGPLTFASLTSGAEPQPGSMRGEVALFSLPGAWGQSLWQTSLEQADFARASGAAAVVHILDSGFPASIVRQLGSSLAQPRWRLGGDAFLPRLFVGVGRLRRDTGRVPPGPGRHFGPGYRLTSWTKRPLQMFWRSSLEATQSSETSTSS